MAFSINKLVPSGASASFEIAPALANLNFDFSLYKVEAPKEFQNIGNTLSGPRRATAESGTSHSTARKLGALFERIIPDTPELLKAYGLRASEIASLPTINPRENAEYGFFANRVGADATSIWAAATSGDAAIATHLLACMLARVWEGPEATSIWYEIVQKRKEEIVARFESNNSGDIPTLAAAQQEISRFQLRDWDASARAWLRAADEAKRKEQTQVRLILDNIQKTEISTKVDLYENVIEAWKTALIQMNSLVKGMPLEGGSGGIFLGLSSWHLYPDLLAIGGYTSSPVEISQGDALISSGGILTLGLKRDVGKGDGLVWSMPLAHLRYYGAPVWSSASLSTDKSRVSFDEFMIAILGSVLHKVAESASDMIPTIRLLACGYRLLENSASTGNDEAKYLLSFDDGNSWPVQLLRTASKFVSSKSQEQKIAKKLLRLGHSHGSNFLEQPNIPLFGFLDPRRYLPCLRYEEDRIRILRGIAMKLPYKPYELLIRYRHTYPEYKKYCFEWTTATPVTRNIQKRGVDDEVKSSSGHRRWIYKGHQIDGYADSDNEEGDLEMGEFLQTRRQFSKEQDQDIGENYSKREGYYSALGEEVMPLSHNLDDLFAKSSVAVLPRKYIDDDHPSESSDTVTYTLLVGDSLYAGIFVENRIKKSADHRSLERESSIENLSSTFQSGGVKPDKFVDMFFTEIRQLEIHDKVYLRSLRALSAAANIYRKCGDATIDVRVLRRPLLDASWVPSLKTKASSVESMRFTKDSDLVFGAEVCDNLSPLFLDRNQTFSCVCMFESGRFNVQPERLSNVIAMSSGDSLFVAASALCDPGSNTSYSDLKRIAGNVGRPGIAFLELPEEPLIKKHDLDSWHLINRDEYDFQRIDCFSATTLHLSFTGSVSPIDVGTTSGRDVEVYLLESVVSVHDRGAWVADLNIPWNYFNWMYHANKQCTHPDASRTKVFFTSIDNWAELLDSPESHAVVRAHKNWQGRLAAASVSLMKGYSTVILPTEKTCWQCLGALYAKSDPVVVID